MPISCHFRDCKDESNSRKQRCSNYRTFTSLYENYVKLFCCDSILKSLFSEVYSKVFLVFKTVFCKDFIVVRTFAAVSLVASVLLFVSRRQPVRQIEVNEKRRWRA